MADFCVQCAEEHGFPETDFPKREAPLPDHGYLELCEGCGPTLVDGDGRCIAVDCPEGHGAKAAAQAERSEAGEGGGGGAGLGAQSEDTGLWYRCPKCGIARPVYRTVDPVVGEILGLMDAECRDVVVVERKDCVPFDELGPRPR